MPASKSSSNASPNAVSSSGPGGESAAAAAAAAAMDGASPPPPGGGHGGPGGDRYEVLAASAPHKRKQGPKHHSRSYPRGVGLDFRKLAGLTLASYIDHHGT